MYTEYVFENREYDVALRNVKSILFDIVMAEQAKVTAIIGKAQTTGDEKLQEKLIELCNEQGECLHSLLEISNSFRENLQKLDSYSRELKRIENKNIANIITGMRKQKAVERGNNPVAANDELEEINKKQEELNKEQEELLEKEQEAQKIIEQVEQEQQEPHTDEQEPQVEEQEQQSEGPVVKSVEVIEDEEMENNPEELASAVGIDIQGGDLGSGVMTTSSTTAIDDKNADKGMELAKSLGINLPDNLGSGVIKFNSTASINENNELVDPKNEESAAPEEEKKEEEQESSIPVIIPQVVSTPEEEAKEENKDENVEEKTEETNSPVIIPTITESETKEETKPVIEINEEQAQQPEMPQQSEAPQQDIEIRLHKNNDDEVKAILTSETQFEKLKLSRFSQEAILNTKNFFEITPTDEQQPVSSSSELVIPVATNNQSEQVIIPQTEQVIPQVNNGELVIPQATPTNEQQSTQVVQVPTAAPLEQQLMDNNLLPNDINSLQAQIDQKMAQAKQLYEAGQTQEAQNLYNEISELSKSLQNQQQGMAMAA